LRGGSSRKAPRIDDAENSNAADAVAFSPDGSTLMSGHRDGTLRTWNVSTGEIVGAPVRAAGCSIGSLASSDDGQMLVLGTEREALLLDAGDRRLLRTLPLDHEGAVTALALSSDGSLLAVAGDDATLWLYDTVTPKAKGRKIEGLLAVVRSLAFSPDGAYLVSGNAEGSTRVWDVGRGRPVGKPQDAHRGAVVALAFAPDGERFLSSGTSGAIRPWPAPRTWLGQMCGKLTTNLSRKAWEEWVSPDTAYRCQCPELPVAADDRASAPSKENCSP
jgi:WD40 repeat protein